MSTATKVIGFALAGGVGYWLYEKYWAAPVAAAPAPTGPGGIVPAGTPMPVPAPMSSLTLPVSNITPPVPVTLSPPPPVPTVAPPPAGGFFTPAATAAASTTNTLLQQLEALSAAQGDHQIQRNVDNWNFLLNQINPSAKVDDLSEVGIVRGTNDAMLAESYMAYRAQAGLSGFTRGLAAAYGRRFGASPVHRTMVFANRRNYVRVA